MKFIENYIFEIEKDKPFGNSGEFYLLLKDKYKLGKQPNLYKRIINYQIKKYGEALNNSKLIDIRTHEDCVKKSENAKSRLYFRIKGRKENTKD